MKYNKEDHFKTKGVEGEDRECKESSNWRVLLFVK